MKIDFKNELETVEIGIYDEIGAGSVNVQDIIEQLKQANNKPLSIHINSNGGEVFEGFAIYNAIKNYSGSKTVYIDGLSASIASVIAMSGDKIIMNKASMMMIHNASGMCIGNAEEMKKVIQALEQIDTVIKQIYVNRSKLSIEKITELMKDEKFISADECLEYGLCDEILEEKQDTTVIQNTLDKCFENYDKRIKQLKDLKEVLGILDDKKETNAFFNKKNNHYDWLRKEFK